MWYIYQEPATYSHVQWFMLRFMEDRSNSASQGSVKAHPSQIFGSNIRLNRISFASMLILLKELLNM